MKRVVLIISLLGIFLTSGAAFAKKAVTTNVIRKLEIAGNSVIVSEKVLLAVKLKPGDLYTKEAIQEDVNNIYMLGYFADVGAEIEDFENGKKVIFKVIENSTIRRVKIKGNTVLSDEEIKKIMKSQEGRVFNIPVLNADVKRIGELYAEQGYTFSGVTNLDVQEQGEVIKIDITEGKLEEVKINGKHRTKDYVILKQLDLKKGDIFNSTKVMKSFQKIFNLGFFETVKPKYSKGTKNPADVVLTIQIKEQKTGTASLGGGYSSANGFVGYLEVSQNNFRGRAQKVKVKVELGGITTYELGFFDPYFRKNTSLGLSLYKTEIEREYISSGSVVGLYDENRTGYTISTGHPIGDRTRLSFKFRDEDIEIQSQPAFFVADNATATLLDATSDHIQVFSGTVTKDTRNNYLNPSAGRMDSLTVSTTGGMLRGKNQYTKYVGKMQRYWGLNKRGVMAVRMISGFTSVSGDDQLPVYEEYNVGGANTLRGYRTNEFTGRKMLLFNSEYRHSFNKNFTGVLFVDGGDAWGIDPALKTSLPATRDDFDVKWTAGVGIRFHSPVGPIRLDYGKPLSDSDNDGESYFSMGSLF